MKKGTIMNMLDTTMKVDDINIAISYMLPYLNTSDKRQIKIDLDNFSMAWTKEQHDTLCASLYSIPACSDMFDMDGDFMDSYDYTQVDSTEYVGYVDATSDFVPYMY